MEMIYIYLHYKTEGIYRLTGTTIDIGGKKIKLENIKDPLNLVNDYRLTRISDVDHDTLIIESVMVCNNFKVINKSKRHVSILTWIPHGSDNPIKYETLVVQSNTFEIFNQVCGIYTDNGTPAYIVVREIIKSIPDTDDMRFEIAKDLENNYVLRVTDIESESK